MSAAPLSGHSRVSQIAARIARPLKQVRHISARRANRRSDDATASLAAALFSAPVASPQATSQLPQRHVHDINDPTIVEFVRDLKPDAILVNGTNLLRQPWHLLAPRIPHGIINIHTGLSPYSRGGNCNLFCILHGQLQCVGVTVHHIDAGIDSGDIIYTDRPTVTREDSFESIELKVFRLGEDLAALALRQIEAGESIPRIRQWTSGREFLRRTGYQYTPHQRVLANRRLHDQGLLDLYLRFQNVYDRSARVINPTDPVTVWRHPRV